MAEMEGAPEQLGGGAQFWAIVGNDSKSYITGWKVLISQGDWGDTITSDDPTHIIKTPDLSGDFKVQVMAEGPEFDWQELPAAEGCNADIGCNSNCASMVSLSTAGDGTNPTYCTTWDAMCS